MKYMKLYFNDWAMSTRVLTLEEKGAWVDLIAILSSSETPGEVTLCPRSLGRLWGVTPRKANTFLESISGAGLVTFEKKSEKIRINCNEIEKANLKYSEIKNARKYAGSRSAATKASKFCSTNGQQVLSKCSTNGQQTGNNINKLLVSTTTTNKNSSSSRGAKKKPKASPKAKPPTLDEVLSFCASRNIPSSTGEAFFNYYEGHNLWLNKNKEPIKWWFVIQNDPWKNNHEHNNSTNRRGSVPAISRNTGTANETDGSEYADVGKVVRD